MSKEEIFRIPTGTFFSKMLLDSDRFGKTQVEGPSRSLHSRSPPLMPKQLVPYQTINHEHDLVLKSAKTEIISDMQLAISYIGLTVF